MSLKQRLKHEFKAMLLASFYFGCWVGALVLLKNLLLAEYRIATYGGAAAIFGALILAKVVLILEHVPLRRLMGKRPAWIDVIVRTVLYSFGVVIALALERGVKGWSEHGGFFPALEASLERSDPEHVWVNAIAVCGAMLGYNALTVIRRNIGDAALLRMFTTPMPQHQPGHAA
jgi:hypothetical protein